VSEAVLEHHGHDHGHGHEPHLAGPSWWPAILATGIGLMAFGFASSFSGPRAGGILMGIGLAVMAVGSARWWVEMIRELKTTPEAVADAPTDQQTKDLKVGFVLFIGSEIMFFGAFFAYYFYSRITAPVWPPEGVHHLEKFLPFVNTLLLISSGMTFNWAEHSLKHGKRANLKTGLGLSILLGTIFLMGQMWEYAHMELSIKTGSLGTAFYMLTGFHGAHVIVGVIFLTVCLFRALAGDFTGKRHTALQMAGWYWHFVDVVWIFLFALIYLPGRSS